MLEVYRRLAQRLDAIPQGFGDIEDENGLELLARLFTPEEAALACVMRMNYEPAADIAARAGMPSRLAYRVLNAMYRKRLINGSVDENQIMFGLAPWIIGVYEYQVPNMDVETAELAERMWIATRGGGTVTHPMPALMRVVPADNTIPVDHRIAPYDQVMKILEGAKAWGVCDCVCRYQKKLIGKGCGNPLDVCLMLTPEGESNDHPLGKRITLEEARQILHRSEQAGLVHMIGNHSTSHTVICNCCGCCCTVLGSVCQFDVPAAALSSDFYAVVDADACMGCEECLQRCHLKALSVPDHVCVVNYDRCVGCGLCSQTCPNGALHLARRPQGEIPPPPHDLREWMLQRAQQRGIQIEDIWDGIQTFSYFMS